MIADEPGRSVRRADSSPPVHDSATAIVSSVPSSIASTCWSTVVPSSENSVSGCRARTRSANCAYTAASAGSYRVTTSTSPRRRHVVTSSRSSSIPASTAARSVAAISDSGIPNRRSVARRYSAAPASAARTSGVSTATDHIG